MSTTRSNWTTSRICGDSVSGKIRWKNISTGVHHATVALEAFGVAVAAAITVMIAEGAVVVAATVADGKVAVAVVVGLAVNVAVVMSIAVAVALVSALIQLLR